MRATLIAAAALAATVADAGEFGPTLSDLTAKTPYRLAYQQALRELPSQPAWLRRFNDTGDGVQSPVQAVQENGRRYQVAEVCQPHQATTCLVVVFDTTGGAVRARASFQEAKFPN